MAVLEKGKTYYENPLRKRSVRKELCICGSKRKIRKCHGKEKWITVQELNFITRKINQ